MTVRSNWIDTTAMPEWGTGPDGRSTKIGEDARLADLFAEWQDDACRHPATVIVETADSLGRPLFFRFCEHCGLKLSSAIAHARAGTPSDYTAVWMEARNDGYVTERKARLDKLIADAAERCQGSNREAYSDYLRSDAWKRRAAKIMQRAGGTCEGCLTLPATEVHHLTYAHLGREFAFELVALCGSCHHRIHSEPA